MSGNSIRDTFFEECEELLEALVEGLSQMEEAGDDMEVVNAVFRAVHSIKGGAGAFGLDRLVGFAHSFETVMDRVRNGQLSVDEGLMGLFHRSGDQLSDLVVAARDGIDLDKETETSLLKELENHLGDEAEDDGFNFDALTLDFSDSAPEVAFGDLAVDDTDEEITASPSASPALLPGEGPTGAKRFSIRFEPNPVLYENGHEPLLLFDALAELGRLEVQAYYDRLPTFDAYSPTDSLLGWELSLETSESETVLHEIFEFVEGLCTLEISAEDVIPTENLVELHPSSDDTEAETPASEESAISKIEPVISFKGNGDAIPTPLDKAEGQKAAPVSTRPRDTKGPKPTLRVDLDRVDRLINTVGELIINQAMIAQRIEELDLPTVAHLNNELEAYKLLARDIQEGVMAIRAQPVKPLFQRMSRIVREASDATNKRAKLITVGDSTEVDKTVIERLADPLTHMVRNAVDHGLETPEDRERCGKDPVGTIRLSAAHRSGSVCIEISDDGAGLNREKILRKAIEKKLIPEDSELSEPEIDNLLFLPGFSTAGQVSNLSGRGVGMDVVKNAVQALGGRVSISSIQNQGSVFSIVLPLTLAVMDGFVISVSNQTMVIPISSIIETIRPKNSDIHRVGTDCEVISVRGSYVPIIDVAENLGIKDDTEWHRDSILLLVETEQCGFIALRVSAIHDQRQVVIKSLESNYAQIPGVSAATILGDGKIALILDPEQLIQLAQTTAGERHYQNTRLERRNA
ncbi:chemotaxis protein CheA [Cognatishimia sp. F0-27]|uniref:chemotaxis protein CheA n=1 Tax=Cognatishimia sp. F0-27 TaxID=2816855 RepID=UPI001D0C1BBB|nr:chemotaxis protein CheA [Cognatishimia sp. F0-27]MCC1492057.1 chemotaxis protein CheA [Cognatishimia sp. F0-27]